jgi:hypothetical protein
MMKRLWIGLAVAGGLSIVAWGQNGAPMVFASVGTPQAVPPAVGVVGETGSMDMVARWYNSLPLSRLLEMSVRYLPPSYVSIPGETVTLLMQFGSASAPGIPFQQATIYIPLNAPPIRVVLGEVGANGPGDGATPTSVGGTGAFCPFTDPTACNRGRRFSIIVPANLSGVPLTAQYVMHDPARNRYYSSNAINMTPP